MPNDKIAAHREAGILSCSRRGALRSGTALSLVAVLPASLAQAATRGADSAASLWQGRWPVRPLLQADLSKLLDEKGRHKPVHDRHVLDDMEDDAGWIASPAVQLGYTSERSRVGTRSLRFSTLLRNEEHIRAARRPNGTFQGDGVLFEGQPFAAFARLRFKQPQDWSGYNRISLWAYLHPTDNPINTISIQFLSEGASAGPLDPVAVHYVGDLRAGEWNHIVWEIPEHQRDRVVEFTIFQTLSGVSVAGADPRVTFDFDDLAVERIDAEPPKGWSIAPGTIAYSHVGYQPAGPKVAIAPEGPDQFELLDAEGGRTIATFPAQRIENARGIYRVLDFTGFAGPGRYRIRHGAAISEAFPIGEDAWRFTIEATLNAFYGLRCGFPLPGVHDACHQDVFAEYKGDKRSIEGGWHDAANLTQSPYRTHLSIYALLELHDALVRKGDHALAERALEEARWGLDWSVRTRFAPGLRALYNHVSYWTDSLRDTFDDVVQDDARGSVGRDDFQNTLGVLVAARAVRTLRRLEPAFAASLLKAATEDFALITAAISAPPTEALPREINEPSWRDTVGYLTLTAVELYRTTGNARYAEEAVRFGRWLVQIQERRFVDGIGISGYFYEDAGRTRIVHEYHNSFEDCGLLAFAALCDALPSHPEWMEWHVGLAIYAEHYCVSGSKASAPFDVVPAAVWRQADLDAPQPLDRTGMMLAKHPNAVFPTPPTPELIRRQMQQQYADGTPLGPNHRLRVFPLWYDHVRKGATTVHMSKTIGLGVAAAALHRPDLSDLAARQVQWVLGTNPFSRSLIYGVGNAFWQNFTVALPNFVGGMSLGFNSYEGDAPAWGNNAVFPYKEMWVYSNCRMAMNLARIGIGASVSGSAPQGAEFRNERTGAITRVRPGKFGIQLASGRYAVRFGGVEQSLSVADGTTLTLALDPLRSASLAAVVRSSNGRRRTIELSVTGSGSHQLETKIWNAKVVDAPDTVQAGKKPAIDTVIIEIIDPLSPWYLHCSSGSGPGNSVTLSGR
ncbi:glycoside hydrolase family 9 protein [Novosphingobium flavum]|uniref:Glycoside hydrolase family 9 protein n=1 Tax=Novosphingobium flavum TaxID=1778672 RepID=A0A7X1FNS7_9SPHN|nr:glycoside hydrolase family 9 protein [Novosphingobium flavum]MBC2664188.1 glycoside hydrolase family 9 protein [Novosphingobium flavum]